MSVAGVVLAAGRSERMGAPKALLDFRGRPFVIRILEALEALDLKPRVVVLGPDAPRIRPALAAHECLIVENLDVAGGPLRPPRAARAGFKAVRPPSLPPFPVGLPPAPVNTYEPRIEAYSHHRPPCLRPHFSQRPGH